MVAMYCFYEQEPSSTALAYVNAAKNFERVKTGDSVTQAAECYDLAGGAWIAAGKPERAGECKCFAGRVIGQAVAQRLEDRRRRGGSSLSAPAGGGLTKT